MEYNLDERRIMESSFLAISPFEFKNKLIELATDKNRVTRTLLDAGRGNPNWIAATPREAFFALGQFAVGECKRVWNERDLAGMAQRQGIAERFRAYAEKNRNTPGMPLLQQIVDWGIHNKQFNPDEWVFELVDGIIGDNYPTPDRMLVHVEKVVHDFVLQEMCSNEQHLGEFDLFAVEGATAAMCYLFDSLVENKLLAPGDKVAVMVPVFPPYIEIAELERYQFDIVEIMASALNAQGQHTWQYPQEEIDKLTDPSIKALFLVNPSNPPSVAIDQETSMQLMSIVNDHNPNLIIISDDVYCTFVDDFRSLFAELPYNTIGVYSFSKYYGVTGW